VILRTLFRAERAAAEAGEPRSAWELFDESQKNVRAPYAIVFQAEHSRIAGQFAATLCEQAFGELEPEVIQAIAEHDFGWNDSDRRQVDGLGERSPRPFPALSAEETLPSWWSSVAHARSVSPLVEVLVSRHFSLLGAGDAGRAEFVRSETERRKSIEAELPYGAPDLDRWTDAMGFCDIVSLYLCSGCREPVKVPLAHPSRPAAAGAPMVTVWWQEKSLRFAPGVLGRDAVLSAEALEYSGRGKDVKPLRLEWAVGPR
jgi:Protein of unknown function (DUF3891)